MARLHEQCERDGIDYWLFGGWAVDFHAGRISRPHADLDVAVWQADLSRVDELLTAEGWAHASEPGEDGSTLYTRDGLRVELAFLARDEDGEAYTPLRDGRAEWAAGAFEGDVAELNGVRARVISVRSLREEKSQRREDETAAAKDRVDLQTLADL